MKVSWHTASIYLQILEPKNILFSFIICTPLSVNTSGVTVHPAQRLSILSKQWSKIVLMRSNVFYVETVIFSDDVPQNAWSELPLVDLRLDTSYITDALLWQRRKVLCGLVGPVPDYRSAYVTAILVRKRKNVSRKILKIKIYVALFEICIKKIWPFCSNVLIPCCCLVAFVEAFFYYLSNTQKNIKQLKISQI